MAISLNEGSFGLLMDPLNGAADIESRTLRLVSNYGFLEQPSLLIRASRYVARLGWELDSKTLTRYENAKGEGVIEYLSAEARSQELEQIGHEEDGLKVLRALETEGWMKFLFPAWTSVKADEERLKALHDLAVELLLQGIHPDMSAAQMQLLTAKLSGKELTALKRLMLRPGFVEEWDSLDALAAGFAKVLLAKANATPSTSYKLFTSYDPEAILWLGFTSKDPVVRERFDLFLKVWPEARQRVPHTIMQEMRITPELAAYRDIVHAVFLELIDGRLTTPEEIRAFLEPHSPPAPPPQVTIKRSRARRGEAKVKEEAFDDEDEAEEALDEDEDLDDLGVDEDEIDLGLKLPKVDLESEIIEDGVLEPDLETDSEEDELEEEDSEPVAVPMKRVLKAPEVKPGTSKVKKPKAQSPAKAQLSLAKSKTAPLPKPTRSSIAKKAAPVPAKETKKLKPMPSAIGKVPAKSSAKTSAKAVSDSAGRTSSKTAAKAPHKNETAKTMGVKGKPAPKSGKRAQPIRPSKPTSKKPAPKPGKKR
jgi:hypothetical protein